MGFDPRAIVSRELAALDGRFADHEIGRRVESELTRRLAELPLAVVALEAAYPGAAVEKFRAAARERATDPKQL